MGCSMPLSFTVSRSLLKIISTESVTPFNHLILCRLLLLLLSVFPSIRVFPNESVLHIRWPKYWSFSISPSTEYSGLISWELTGLISLLSKGLSRVFSSTTVWKHQVFGVQPSVWSDSQSIHTTGKTIALSKWTFVSKVMFLLSNMLSRFCHSFSSQGESIF